MIKQQIWLIIVLTLTLHVNGKLGGKDDLLCKFLDNPFTHRSSIDDYQLIEQQRDFLKPEKIQQKFQTDMLNAHNILRKKHCVPSLLLDEKLSQNAQAYAEHLAKQDRKLTHSNSKNSIGENLYSSTSSKPIVNPDANKVTQSWYNENVNYNYDKPGSNINTDHFTQIVWKDTTKIGAGIAFSRDGQKMYVVAQYSPAGNDQHAYKNNVFPPKC